MSKHTPLPWQYGIRADQSIWFAAGDMRPGRGPHWQGDFPGTVADARLITAAPTLAAALEGLMEAVPTQTNDRDWWPDELTRAMAAARKALDEAGIEP